MKWQSLPFDEVFADESGGNIKTPTSEYLTEGKYPIVDQGQDFIAGFANDARRICGNGKSAVIFGDHTRCVKFVDFPFCMGADGVKVLRSKFNADLKYLYHALRYLDIPNAGYDRHFKYLKRKEIPLAPLPEQRRIAEILDKAEALQVKRRAALSKLDTLAQSIFLDMFGDPATNPREYQIKKMIEIVDTSRPISYGILMPGEDIEDGVKYVRVVDIQNGAIDHSKVRRTTPEISNAFKRSILMAGDLLMSIRGHVGRLAIVPKELDGANITQDSVRLAIVDAVSRYICEFLRSPGIQYWMKKHVKGVAVKGINLGDLKIMPVMLPPLPLQQAFARRIEAIEALKERHRASLAKLDALFASLQHRAFRGEL